MLHGKAGTRGSGGGDPDPILKHATGVVWPQVGINAFTEDPTCTRCLSRVGGAERGFDDLEKVTIGG